MHRGYIKLWRKTKDSFIWEDSEILKIWIHLLMEANHENKEHIFNGKVEKIKRGSLICGRISLSNELGIHESKIYRSLAILEKEQLIEQQKTNLYTIVSIVKYNKYQSNEQQTEQPANNQRTTSEQPANTPKALRSINKNLKEVCTKPTVEEIQNYCLERNNGIDPKYFFDKNEGIGWVVGKNKTPMKDWKAVIRTWEKYANDRKPNGSWGNPL